MSEIRLNTDALTRAATAHSPAALLDFWRAAGPARWFTKDLAFDAEVRARFLDLYEAGANGELAAWEGPPEGALALTIVLDQLPRNLFRGDARTFATDPAALAVAERALARGFDQRFPPADRQFFYLPFMHSETRAGQERSLALYRAMGDPELLKHAEIHADIVFRFGRFPHRNPMLGRPTTAEEQAFLDAGGWAG